MRPLPDDEGTPRSAGLPNRPRAETCRMTQPTRHRVGKFDRPPFTSYGRHTGTRLLGSTDYVAGLSAAECDRIALYMNYDMIGSPDYIVMVYDADDSTFPAPAGVTIPPGSQAIEDLYESYDTWIHEPYDDIAFDGRSDYRRSSRPASRPADCSPARKSRRPPSSRPSGAAPPGRSPTPATTWPATRSTTSICTPWRSTAT